MSYNISCWRTITLDNLTLPMLFTDVEITKTADNKTLVTLWDDRSEIEGILGEDDMLYVERIQIQGEGSGRVLVDVGEALKHSTGVLDAVLIWEGGDRITRFRAVNGVVSGEEVDLIALLKR